MIVTVRASPGSRRERVEVTKEGVFVMAVREEAQNGAATGRVRTLLAQHYKVGIKNVRIVSGAQSTTKRFRISR